MVESDRERDDDDDMGCDDTEDAAAFHYSGMAKYSPAPVVTFNLDDIPHFDYHQVGAGEYVLLLIPLNLRIDSLTQYITVS